MFTMNPWVQGNGRNLLRGWAVAEQHPGRAGHRSILHQTGRKRPTWTLNISGHSVESLRFLSHEIFLWSTFPRALYYFVFLHKKMIKL